MVLVWNFNPTITRLFECFAFTCIFFVVSCLTFKKLGRDARLVGGRPEECSSKHFRKNLRENKFLLSQSFLSLSPFSFMSVTVQYGILPISCLLKCETAELNNLNNQHTIVNLFTQWKKLYSNV